MGEHGEPIGHWRTHTCALSHVLLDDVFCM